jgi:hypothetical protein
MRVRGVERDREREGARVEEPELLLGLLQMAKETYFKGKRDPLQSKRDLNCYLDLLHASD